MQVKSIRGKATGPTTRTQQDIVNKTFPRENLKESQYGPDDLPGLAAFKEGSMRKDSERSKARDNLTKFVHTTLRMKPMMREWYLELGDIDKKTVSWRALIGPKDINRYSLHDLAEELAGHIAELDSVAAAIISLDEGMKIGSSTKKLSGDPKLVVTYRAV